MAKYIFMGYKGYERTDEEFCSLCKVNITQTLCHLQQYEASNKHRKASGAVSSNRKTVAFFKERHRRTEGE